MAFIIDDILRVPGKLLRLVVTVKKGSRQMMLLGSETTDQPRAGTRRGGKPARRYRTGEDLKWPKTVFILDNTVLAPLKFVRWVVNRVRRQVDSEITNESDPADGSASRSRPGSTAAGPSASNVVRPEMIRET